MLDEFSSFFNEPDKKDKLDNTIDRVSSIEYRFKELQIQQQKLKTLVLAMWKLLQTHTGLKKSDLLRYIEQIDSNPNSTGNETCHCDHCGRVVLRTAQNCIYCGKKLSTNSTYSID